MKNHEMIRRFNEERRGLRKKETLSKSPLPCLFYFSSILKKFYGKKILLLFFFYLLIEKKIKARESFRDDEIAMQHAPLSTPSL